jgi:hypothetical protein
MRSCLLIFLISIATVVPGQSPAAIERQLIGHLAAIEKHGTYRGHYAEELSDKANARLRSALVRFGNRRDVLKYGFPKLKGKMFVATSRDGRFRIYSWDLETGGTMHDFDSVYQFEGKSGKVAAWRDKAGNAEEASGFFTEIFQVDAAGSPIYLGVSNFIASSSYGGQSVSAFSIIDDKLVVGPKVIKTAGGLQGSVGFAYDFFSVVDHPERPVKLIFFDGRKKEFRFPVVIEDEETPQGRVTGKFIRYRFDGKYFVKAG